VATVGKLGVPSAPCRRGAALEMRRSRSSSSAAAAAGRQQRGDRQQSPANRVTDRARAVTSLTASLL